MGITSRLANAARQTPTFATTTDGVPVGYSAAPVVSGVAQPSRDVVMPTMGIRARRGAGGPAPRRPAGGGHPGMG